MKSRNTKLFASALAVSANLLVLDVAQAQFTSTVLTDFHNFNLSVTYANWNVDGSDPLAGGSGFTPVITSGATSYEVKAQDYGSGAFNFDTPLSVPGATRYRLTLTLNTPMMHGDGSGLWFGPNLDISDGTHMVHLTSDNAGGGFLDYGPYVGPGTYSIVGFLNDQNGGGPLDTTTITAFNLEVDPAEYGAGAPYDITYNSLELLTPTPEPSVVSLLTLSGIGAIYMLRRNRAS